MNKKTLITIIILICLIIGAVGFYFYLKNFKVAENLTSFMPRETDLFVELNLKNKNLIKFYENNFRGQARLEALFNQTKMFDDLPKNLIDEIDKIAVLVLSDEEDENLIYTIWIVQANNIHRLSALLPVNYFFTNLNSNTVAISDNHDALKKIRQIDPLAEHTLEQRKSLGKFNSENFINLYLSGKYAQELSTKNDSLYFLALNNLDLNYDKSIYLGLTAMENKVQIECLAEKNNEEKSAKFDENENNLLNYLFSETGWLKFALADLKNIFENLTDSLITQQDKKDWQEKYEFNWQILEKIFDNPGIFFVENKNEQIENEQVLNLKQNNYAILIKTNFNEKEINEKMQEIKNLIKNILAFKYPTQINKLLPDGTTSQELIADANRFNFDNQDNLDFIEFKTFSFALGNKESYLVVGNNKELVENILTTETNTKNNNSECFNFASNEIMTIDSTQLVDGLLSFVDKSILNIEYNQKNIKINGCLLW